MPEMSIGFLIKILKSRTESSRLIGTVGWSIVTEVGRRRAIPGQGREKCRSMLALCSEEWVQGKLQAIWQCNVHLLYECCCAVLVHSKDGRGQASRETRSSSQRVWWNLTEEHKTVFLMIFRILAFVCLRNFTS